MVRATFISVSEKIIPESMRINFKFTSTEQQSNTNFPQNDAFLIGSNRAACQMHLLADNFDSKAHLQVISEIKSHLSL